MPVMIKVKLQIHKPITYNYNAKKNSYTFLHFLKLIYIGNIHIVNILENAKLQSLTKIYKVKMLM